MYDIGKGKYSNNCLHSPAFIRLYRRDTSPPHGTEGQERDLYEPQRVHFNQLHGRRRTRQTVLCCQRSVLWKSTWRQSAGGIRASRSVSSCIMTWATTANIILLVLQCAKRGFIGTCWFISHPNWALNCTVWTSNWTELRSKSYKL